MSRASGYRALGLQSLALLRLGLGLVGFSCFCGSKRGHMSENHLLLKPEISFVW